MLSTALLSLGLTTVLTDTTVYLQIFPPRCLASTKLKKYQDKFLIFPFKLVSSAEGLPWPKDYISSWEAGGGGWGRGMGVHSWGLQPPSVQITGLLVEGIFVFISGLPEPSIA